MKHIKTKYEILRQKTYILIHGSGTIAGKTFDLILLGVILLSLLLIMMASISKFDNKYHSFFYISEWIITVFFSIEYILRIISNKKPLSYIFSFYGVVDLLSLLPMYLSFFIPGSEVLGVIRTLRLLRLFAILDLIPILNQSSHIKESLRASMNKIIVFVYFVIVMSIVLGTIMFMVEGGHNGFSNIPNSIYWCIVTMTTVGYGDIAPITPIGKTIASFIMIMGYGIIAVPTGIVTAELSRNRKSKDIKNNCPRCKTYIYNEFANYCYNCGEKLIDGTVEIN
ncbi:voltage-gated potassium channel [Paenimyroides aquimaris]|uniref:Voltage-gated potassium channel n=1 Tax=Paenimyroides marinum TaxID=1159016 RepID=A0A1H6K6N4_9FLAO|nr:ion transporter [Paenimyroides aquimaris]SEH68942.1 voltage-gated potassium channel [Paenimyroides aquimaris]